MWVQLNLTELEEFLSLVFLIRRAVEDAHEDHVGDVVVLAGVLRLQDFVRHHVKDQTVFVLNFLESNMVLKDFYDLLLSDDFSRIIVS